MNSHHRTRKSVTSKDEGPSRQEVAAWRQDLNIKVESHIRTAPWTTSPVLMGRMMEIHPIFARFFFTERVGNEISEYGKKLLMRARTDEEAGLILAKYVNRSSTSFKMKSSFMRNTRKDIESRSNRLLYGLQKGYAFDADLTVEDHARWAHTRSGTIARESPKWKLSIGEMVKSRRHAGAAIRIKSWTSNMQDQQVSYQIQSFIAKFL